jgi:uncharacterized protein
LQDAASLKGPADTPYWKALSKGRLTMQHCQGCGRWRWPACWRCGDCGTWAPQWEELPVEGEVFSWTRVHYAFAGAEGLKPPYVTVLAALPQADGKRLLGLYEGDEAELAIGKPLKGRIDRTTFRGDQIPVIRWRLA